MGTTAIDLTDKMPETTKLEMAVEMKSPCCVGRVEKSLEGLTGIKSVNIDLASQKLVIEGEVLAEVVKDRIEKETGMSAVVLGVGGTSANNLGAGVVPIKWGPSGIKGLLRLVQTKPETCLIEGALENLPPSENLFLCLHEYGDLSAECESCGPPLGSEEGKDNELQGVLSPLTVEEDGGAHFRFSTRKVKLTEMIGRCMVIHEGKREDVEQSKSNRLACGLVARASGLFQNSKRFCACDGTTIWEEKEKQKFDKI